MQLRLATPRDGPAIAAIYRPAVIDSAASFELVPPDAAEMASRVTRTLTHVPWIVCEAASGVLGFAYAGRHRERPAYRWSVEVSTYVRADARRAGIGRALYTSLLALLGVQGFRNVYAGIALPNDASMALHRAVGFASIGVYRNVGYKHGAWHDVEWLALTLGAHDPDPAPPTPLPELLGRAALQDAIDAGTSRVRVGIGK